MLLEDVCCDIYGTLQRHALLQEYSYCPLCYLLLLKAARPNLYSYHIF
jgi:hypothetical protein